MKTNDDYGGGWQYGLDVWVEHEHFPFDTAGYADEQDVPEAICQAVWEEKLAEERDKAHLRDDAEEARKWMAVRDNWHRDASADSNGCEYV